MRSEMVISPKCSFIVKNSYFFYPWFFCYSRLICKLLFLRLWWVELYFWGELHQICGLFWTRWSFYYINHASPKVWETFPHFEVFFEFIFRDVKFLSYRLFTYLVRVTPSYLILFVSAVNGVVPLICFSACLSYGKRKLMISLGEFYIQTFRWSC